MRLKLTAPFDFELSLRFVCDPPRAAAHLDWEPYVDYRCGRQYRRVLDLHGQPVLLLLKSSGSIDNPEVEWQTYPPASAEQCAEIHNIVRHIVSSDVDLTSFYAQVDSDHEVRELATRFAGLKIIRAPSLYECLISTVLEQQRNFRFASLVKRSLLETFGPRVEYDGLVYYGFPRPQALAALRPEMLRPLQISERKASYIIGVARAALDGVIDESSLRAMDGDSAVERLMELRGVGRWTAEYALLRGLGHTDALPAEDIGLQKSVGELYGLRGYASPLAIRRRWKPLRPWRGYATYYVWFTQWQ